MIYLLDGSNILGHLGLDRHSSESKRRLVRAAAALARQRKARVLCVFDGRPDEAFATSLGSVSVRFSFPRDADSVIIDEAAAIANDQVVVVTADSELRQKVRRRKVEVVNPRILAEFMEQSLDTTTVAKEDWERYFSDPKNRNV